MNQLSFDDLLGQYSEVIPAERGFHVYRCWLADGRCAYVGVTGIWRPQRVEDRLITHRRLRGWAWLQKMARIDVASFNSARDAVAEEKRQIAELQPLYNKRGIHHAA